MHLAWVFTGLFGLISLGLVGLMAYAKELEAEQQRRRARQVNREADASLRELVDPAVHRATDPAAAGYPGAWDDFDLDDEFEVPRAAAR